MTIKGKVGSFTRSEERARIAGHDPVVLAGQLPAADGVYPCGLLLTRSAANVLIALTLIAAEVLATGAGNVKAYAATLAEFPVEPGTLVITDGVETFTDDGFGHLTGDAGGTGTINYLTGDYAIEFAVNVLLASDIEADYTTAFAGVLDEEVDTAESESGLYVAHGTVDSNVLKVGKVAKAEPTAALLMLMQKKGVYPK
ncbi:MAG: hypothetical protein A2075_12185 [Geobacteraceae bacterium GWC2_58_44]|nr:MAG: hypothetical protein A2075_12185 [Geobacteraceae bacterium GWC2_58_44]HBG06321.1 hypothetical protein [Geobacter sp.]